MLPRAVEGFLWALRKQYGSDVAGKWRDAWELTDIDADGCRDAAAFIRALEWIVAQPRSLAEKVDAVGKIV